VGADFTRHASDLSGEGVELVYHGIDSVFKFKDFALDIHGDFTREVTAGHGSGHLGDVTHLSSQITGHGVHVIREVLPSTSHAWDNGRTAEPPIATDFARHPCHLGGERA